MEMEEEEEEDPFGSLIKFCRPTSSQELKLQNCPFSRHSETFPDAFDSLGSSFSPTPTPSQAPGIVMVSPPESEDENAARENEEFQTPPEHHPSSSSQEDPPLNPKPISVVVEKIDGSDDAETVAVDDGCPGGNLGFSKLGEMDGGDDGVLGGAGCGGDREIERVHEVFERELKKFRVFDDESGEPPLKKIRVPEENWESKSRCRGETKITEEVDDELINLDSEEIDEEIRLNEDKILIDVDPPVEESEDDPKVSKSVGGISDGKSKREWEVKKVKDGGSLGDASDPMEEDVLLDNGEKCALNNVAQNDGEADLGFRVVNLDGRGRSVSRNGDLVVEESEEGQLTNRRYELRKNGKEVLGCMNREDIDKFKYNGGKDDDGNQCWKEVARKRRELPLSMREKGNDREWKERVRNVDVNNLSWKELLDLVRVALEKVDDGSEDVDFLEAAKRKGMNFPLPRWI